MDLNVWLEIEFMVSIYAMLNTNDNAYRDRVVLELS